MITQNRLVVLLGVVGTAIISVLVYLWKDEIMDYFNPKVAMPDSDCKKELEELKAENLRRKAAHRERKIAAGKIRGGRKRDFGDNGEEYQAEEEEEPRPTNYVIHEYGYPSCEAEI
jgi:hypothetical protein